MFESLKVVEENKKNRRGKKETSASDE